MTYKQKLNKLLDDIFAKSVSMTMDEFAKAAKLSVSTIRRLDKRQTEFPRLKTIFLLARAVGLEISLELAKSLKKEEKTR